MTANVEAKKGTRKRTPHTMSDSLLFTRFDCVCVGNFHLTHSILEYVVSKLSDNKSVLRTIANMEKIKTTYEMVRVTEDFFSSSAKHTLNIIFDEKQNHFGAIVILFAIFVRMPSVGSASDDRFSNALCGTRHRDNQIFEYENNYSSHISQTSQPIKY